MLDYRGLGTNFRDYAIVFTQLEFKDEAFNTVELYSKWWTPRAGPTNSLPRAATLGNLPLTVLSPGPPGSQSSIPALRPPAGGVAGARGTRGEGSPPAPQAGQSWPARRPCASLLGGASPGLPVSAAGHIEAGP